MIKIKFGTDGWRAIIAKEYTTDNVARVAQATAVWLKKKQRKNNAVVIGHDCRFGGPMFAEVAAKVFCKNGIKVFMADKFATTPMISLGTERLGAQQGIVITASHNPPTYNGFKLKAEYGGPTPPHQITEVENLIPLATRIPETSLAEYEEQGLVEYVDLETMYLKEVQENFDLKTIQKKVKIGYDAMYGAGQGVLPLILPNAELLHCDNNPSFKGQAPEPLDRNLQELSALLKNNKKLIAGLANDGDADRIGLYDEKGNFVDSHHIILLVIHYLTQYKGIKGKVVTAFSVTDRVKKMCKKYKLEQQTTKIGFKYICEIMAQEDVLLGGEESGGIAVKGFIPERDGIWIGLIIFEFMAKTGKSLQALVKEVYDVVGKFHFERNDLHINDKLKKSIMQNCKKGKYKAFGKYKVKRVETVDGYKFFFNEYDWLMIRPSGTEPVLRVYAEASTKKEVLDMLKEAKAILLKD